MDSSPDTAMVLCGLVGYVLMLAMFWYRVEHDSDTENRAGAKIKT